MQVSEWVAWRKLLDDVRRAAALAGKEGVGTRLEGKRVLIVEDNVDSALSLAMLVQDMGHYTEYTTNGYAAIEIAREWHPEIVLLDLDLPGLDGFAVCSRIKSDPELRNARVIVITGLAQDEYQLQARAAGCEEVLVKPVPTGALERLLG